MCTCIGFPGNDFLIKSINFVPHAVKSFSNIVFNIRGTDNSPFGPVSIRISSVAAFPLLNVNVKVGGVELKSKLDISIEVKISKSLYFFFKKFNAALAKTMSFVVGVIDAILTLALSKAFIIVFFIVSDSIIEPSPFGVVSKIV